MIIRHSVEQWLDLQVPAHETPLWRYVYSGKPKPFFHPLHTPAGFCLSLFEPHDHIWHRGLWFTIKYINGENFWEENDDFGTQKTLLPPTVTHGANGSITLSHEQRWERANDTGSVFAETRRITYVPLDDESYALDWDIALVAQADLLLDRTPFTTWGGYGGLTFRGNRNWQNTRILLSDGTTDDRPKGVPARWCDLSGSFDGGSNREGGLAIFDHPANVRHPSPWYGATGAGHYFNAAFLFHEPLQVSEGETLHLRYRALIHDNLWDVSRLQTAYDAYIQEARNG
ncbi:MAG TPA: PmoA family protein [Abditibacteriaceae bacterium]